MTRPIPAPPGLKRDWGFRLGGVSAKTRLARLWRGTRHRQSGPQWQCIAAITPAERWIGYFVFAPDGVLEDHHRFTLERLRRHDARLAIVCAAPSAAAIPEELQGFADALYWKDLPGFDFSAFAIVVAEVARHAAGANLILMNDSVLGPFSDLYTVFNRAPWGMAGLTGYSLIENHIQSYAFRFRSVDERLAARMERIAGPALAFDRFADVIYCQETRFTRVMANATDAGALWFSDHRAGGGDLPLTWPFGLIDEGFPFLKRSLFTKFEGMADSGRLRAFLEQQSHPLPLKPPSHD